MSKAVKVNLGNQTLQQLARQYPGSYAIVLKQHVRKHKGSRVRLIVDLVETGAPDPVTFRLADDLVRIANDLEGK
jgi:hypothetical protein